MIDEARLNNCRNAIRDSVVESCGLERHFQWKSLLEFPNSKELINMTYSDYKKLREVSHDPMTTRDEISRDILRTFPQHSFFRKESFGSKMLSNILHSFVLFRPDIGYCQVSKN